MMPNEFSIGPHEIGGARCFIIAEVAQAHDGSLGTAHAFIDAVALAGADAVKFQTHIADAESSAAEPWRVKFSFQDRSRFDYWKRMEFAADQWRGLKDHAEDRGLIFLSSPFSLEAVQLLEDLDMQAWKIASGELLNKPLLERIAGTGKPVLLSSGMSFLGELSEAVEAMKASDCPVAVMQCSSVYPTSPEQLGLNVLDDYRRRFDCPVGLSDHTGKIYAGLAACALGANLIEVHVTLSREMFGPDVSSSVTSQELAQLVEGVRFIDRARSNPVNKDKMAAELDPVRQLFTKSLFFTQDLPVGTRLRPDHLMARKPGTGVPASHMDQAVGRVMAAPAARGQMLTPAHFDAAFSDAGRPPLDDSKPT